MEMNWTFNAELYVKELKKVLLDNKIEPNDYIRTEGIIEGIEFCLIGAHNDTQQKVKE